MNGMLIFVCDHIGTKYRLSSDTPAVGPFSREPGCLHRELQDSTADPADTTVALLTQVVHQSTGMTLDLEIPPFKVTTAALVCNVFWFFRMAFSLACSLLATLVEQWAREFLHKTDIHLSPVRRARIFSFLYCGIQQFHMHALVDIIPCSCI